MMSCGMATETAICVWAVVEQVVVQLVGGFSRLGKDGSIEVNVAHDGTSLDTYDSVLLPLLLALHQLPEVS